MCEIRLQTFRVVTVFAKKIVGAFKTDTQGTEVRFNYMDL